MPASDRAEESRALDGDLDPTRFGYLRPPTDPTHFSLSQLVDHARAWLRREREWAGLIHFDPAERQRLRLPVEGGAGHEAWLLSWLPGQGTGLHDHGDSPAVLVVVRGELEEHAVSPYGGPPRQHIVQAGQLRCWAPRHVRSLTNLGPDAAVSLHVYRRIPAGSVTGWGGAAPAR